MIPPVDKFNRAMGEFADANRIVIEFFGSSNSSRGCGFVKMSPQIRIVKGNNGLFLLLGTSLEKCEKVEKNEKTYFF